MRHYIQRRLEQQQAAHIDMKAELARLQGKETSTASSSRAGLSRLGIQMDRDEVLVEDVPEGEDDDEEEDDEVRRCRLTSG